MADIANQLQGASEGLERFLDALDNSSMKLGSNAAIESKLARAAAKKADQELRFKKRIEKMEKEAAKREAAHLARLKAMEPFRKKALNALKQEIKAKADLLKQTKGLGDALKKTGAGMGSMFKSLGASLKSVMGGLGKGFEGGLQAGLKGVMDNLKGIEILGTSVGKIFGAVAASAKLLYDVLSTNEKLMNDIVRQTGLMGDTFKDGFRNEVLNSYKDLGLLGYTLKETVQLTQDMREAFGDTSFVTSELVKTSANLQMAFRVSAENANELVEAMTRSGYESNQFLDTIQDTAIIMGADVGMAMRDVAKNTGMLELYAGRGAEYFAKMASRAAMLGTDMQNIEDSGKAFEDFDQMAENFGKMGQLFGTAFTDGLKDLTEIRMMYERGNILGIQEHIAEQAAKTLYYEDGKLKSLKTQDILYQSQIKQLATTMGMDNVSALRAIKAAEMQEMMNTKNFKIQQDMLKTAESKELFAASEYDYSMAMFSALRDADMKEEDILEKLSEEGKTTAQIIADRKELVSIAEDEMIKRAKIAEEQGNLEQKTLDTMQELDKSLKAINTTFTTTLVTAGGGLEGTIGSALEQLSGVTVETQKGFTQGILNWNKERSTTENIKEVFTRGAKGGVAAAFDDIDAKMLEGKGIADTFEMALVSAVGGDAGNEGIFSAIYNQLAKGTDYLGVLLEDSWLLLQDIFDRFVVNSQNAFDSLITNLANWYDSIGIESDTDEDRQRERIQADIERAAAREKRLQENAAARREELDQRRRLEKMQSGLRFDEGREIDIVGSSSNALGRSGGKLHRGIVGEAGTEVGITRSALRELASIGVPAYQDGFGGFTNVGGLYQAPGSEGARRQRGADNRRVGEEYRDDQRYFLDNLYKDQYEFSRREEKRQASFFIKYPAIVDEAFGRPFRDRGPVATGIYNSIFSGLQAGARAEFAGKRGDQQREAALQAAVAEGIKPGGIINQGLNKIQERSNKVIDAINGGVEREQAKEDELRETFLESSRQYTRALAMGDKKKIAELKALSKSNYEALQVQKKQVSELEKIKNEGAARGRAEASLLSGINMGLQMMSNVVAAGGSREQALEMGKRGAIGGIVQQFTASFGGQADAQFLETMNMMGYILGMKKLPAGTGRSTGDMITEAMDRTERTFQSQDRGLGYSGASLPYGGANAMGRVFNSPHIAVVGEGSQNEIIVPTERIRKGLPINEGVAKELASIGVPGYQNGYSFMDRFRAGQSAQQLGIGPGFSMGTSGGGGYAGRLGHTYQSMGGAASGFATAGMQFANTYAQTGDMGMAAGQALGAGIGFGATMAISAVPVVGPFIGPILGPMIGSFIGNKLGGLLGYKPKHKKFRERTLKSLEDHVLTEGLFDHGQPAGIKDNIEKAIAGGKKKHPTEEAFNKLKKVVNESKVLKRGFMHPGINGEGLLGLLSGQVGNTDQENAMYARYNNAFYGNPVPMATGGVVTRPTNAIVGEAGPEAVIPLNTVGGYSSRDQERDNKTMIDELRRSNQQMQMFIKQIGNARTVLNVDGRQLAETVGQNMYEINTGM